MTFVLMEKGERMPIKGEQQGYTYKVLTNGEWQEVTIQESPLELLELVERFEQDEEWTRVRHGHWVIDMHGNWACSLCGNDPYHDNMKNMNYCPNCGARMDEVEE